MARGRARRPTVKYTAPATIKGIAACRIRNARPTAMARRAACRPDTAAGDRLGSAITKAARHSSKNGNSVSV